jgi:hypothetical protein
MEFESRELIGSVKTDIDELIASKGSLATSKVIDLELMAFLKETGSKESSGFVEISTEVVQKVDYRLRNKTIEYVAITTRLYWRFCYHHCSRRRSSVATVVITESPIQSGNYVISD